MQSEIFVLTAAHVVGDDSAVGLELFYPEYAWIDARVVMTDTAKDLALLIPSDAFPYSAQLAPESYTPYIFTPVFAVGCSLGFPLRPSYGIVSVIEEKYWEISAPILPGNSGGPVFDARTYEVIGIAVWVRVCNGQLITTMGGIVPIQEIYDFLKENDVCLE